MNKMKWNKLLALCLSISMIAGMLSTPVTSFAVSDDVQLVDSAQAEVSVETEVDEDAAVEEVSFDAESESEDEEKETYTFTIGTAKIDAGLSENTSAEEISTKLDELFKPALEVNGVIFRNGGTDEIGFTTSYKFVIIPKSEDITEDDGEYLKTLVLPANNEEYKLIEDDEFSKIPAGSRVLVYTRALTTMGKEFFTANIAYVSEPEVVEEEAMPEAPTEELSSDDEEALISDAEDATVESSESDSEKEDVEENGENEDIPEDSLEEESTPEDSFEDEEISEEAIDDEELVGALPDTNGLFNIGFFGNLLSFNTPSYAKDHLVEVYLTEIKDNKPTKNTWKIGERTLLDPSDYEDKENPTRSFLLANSLEIVRGTIPAGTYRVIAKYHLNDSNPAEISKETSVDDIYTLNVISAPEVDVWPAASASSKGKIVITKDNIHSYYSSGTVVKYGAASGNSLTKDSFGNFYLDVIPGHYRVSLDAPATSDFDVVYYEASEWADVYVPVEETLTSLTIMKNGYETTEFNSYIGSKVQLSIKCNPESFEDDAFEWTSSDPSVAAIDKNTGVLTAKSAGDATITAYLMSDHTYSQSVVCHVLETPLAAPYNPKAFKADRTKVTTNVNTNEKITITGDEKLGEIGASVRFVFSPGALISTTDTGFDDGKYVFDASAAKPGSYTVTAYLVGKDPNPVKEKSVTINLNVNGFNKESALAFTNGKKITGWVNVDAASAITSYGKIDLNDAINTYYIDPATNTLATDVHLVGKKLYLFRSGGELYKDSTRVSKYACSDSLYIGSDYCVNRDGSMCTGWTVPDNYNDKEYYYSPENGEKVTGYWIKKGKGYTYVGEDGISVGATDGINTVTILGEGYKYCFKGGVVQSGFVYEDETGKLFVPASKAYRAYYCDPADGGKVQTGFFMVKGKKYYATPQGKIFINCQFDTTEGSIPYFADKTGAIVTNKLVTDSYRAQYYAGADGVLAKDKTVIVNGKEIYFGNNLQPQAQEGTDTGLNYIIYPKDGTVMLLKLYCKSANPAKPSEGLVYYDTLQCTNKVKNCWICAGSINNKKGYIDKNGRKVTGFRKIDGKLYYFTDEGVYNASFTGVQQIGSKYVYINDDGTVCSTTGFKKTSDSKFIYIKDKNGTLATGLTTIGGKKYAFSEQGELMLPLGSSHMISLLFYCNRTGSPTDEKDAKNFYIVTGKIQKLPDSTGDVVVGKDGTRYTGMYSEGSKKYCVNFGELASVNNKYVIIGGKAYYIGNEGFAVGGWHRCTTGLDYDSYKSMDFGEEGQYFYFDPKTLNPVSGWKTVIAPATDVNGNILCDENVVRTNNTSKKLYFNVNDVQGLQKGALVRNTDITIKGKLYRLGADGSIKTGTEGKTFADESSVAKDAYVKKDGTLATGRTAVKINGQTIYYYYSPRTHKLERNVLRKTGSKWYYYGQNGKQTTGTFIADAIHSNYKAVAVFNKDGSISGFVYETLGGKVKNEVISLDPSGEEESDFYVLGTNALPVTGLYSVPDYLQTTFGGCRKLNIYSDGYLEYVEGSAGIMKMEKIGQKYYLTKNGAILVNPNDSYSLDEIDYSSLPVSDREEIARLAELSKGTLKDAITVMPNKDGSLGMRALNWTAYGYTVYTNRYGFAYDSIAPFYKKGSTWYMSIDAAFFALMAGNSYFDIGMEDTEGDNAVIRMHFDKTFKITSITYVKDDIDTGVAANGIYIIEGADPDGDGEESAPYYLVNFNKGKLATGKKSVILYYGMLSFIANFDSEFGVANYPNMGS